MPKFTYEVDTDAKTVKTFLDGQEMDASEFSVGCYRGKEYGTNDTYNECYASFTRITSENSRLTYSYSFRDGKNPSYSEATTNYTGETAKTAAKAIGALISRSVLEKALIRELNKKNGTTD